ncbi:MAG: zinc metallopeptidase [Bacteroidaceae bacterium]|nr:zinc metallopeptidase [Bacteroidaceae bacterium]MBR1790612.1 zinc metallopeptidase [Bacteroidaceae bacterium]
MDLTGRRQSSNVDDRRGMSTVKKAGVGGIFGIIIAMAIAYFTGGNPLEAGMQAFQQSLGNNTEVSSSQQREFTEEEQQLALFASQVLASTEDVWTEVFKTQLGKTYIPPRMVLYTGAVQTGCGQGTASVGPFYCSADQALYIDLSFFTDMKKTLGADGDFAYAYVIAHEVGHHVQHLLGTLNDSHAKMARMNETDANKVSVRIELQADFYAGVWGHHEGKTYGSLEDGDLAEAINCAQVIGDNYLQEKARGYSQPESFTHGTSAQRMRWLKAGLQTGDMSRGDTFGISESQL